MGDEEARARITLSEMQARLTQGPRTALGIAESASANDVRSAFLQLTKRFHPARFGRMAPDIQKLSNEVFLGIRSAHDTLYRGSAVRSASGSGMLSLEVTGSGAVPSGPSGSLPIKPLGAAAAAPRPAATRPPTPTTPAATSTTRPQPASPTGPRPVVTARPGTPPGTAPNAPMPARTQTPGAPVPPRTLTPSTAPRSASPSGPPVVPQRTAPVFDERAELAASLAMMQARNWSGARQALHALAARVPQSKQYRALLCYARGREAQTAGKPDEAALEFQRALALDPDLAQAKQALAEVQRRR